MWLLPFLERQISSINPRFFILSSQPSVHVCMLRERPSRVEHLHEALLSLVGIDTMMIQKGEDNVGLTSRRGQHTSG